MTGKEKVNNMATELLVYLMINSEYDEEMEDEIYIFYYPQNDDSLEYKEFKTKIEAIDYAIEWLTNEVKE